MIKNDTLYFCTPTGTHKFSLQLMTEDKVKICTAKTFFSTDTRSNDLGAFIQSDHNGFLMLEFLRADQHGVHEMVDYGDSMAKQLNIPFVWAGE